MATRTERTQIIDKLEKEFKGATGIFLTDFTNINVEKITKLRTDFRSAGVKYIVVKNSLARIALERCGLEKLVPYLQKPVGVAITRGEATSPAKIIKDFRKKDKNLLDLRVAYIDGALFDSAQTDRLADLPSKEVLLSQLLSCLNAPMANFVGVLNGILVKLVGTLNAVKNAKEKENGL